MFLKTKNVFPKDDAEISPEQLKYDKLEVAFDVSEKLRKIALKKLIEAENLPILPACKDCVHSGVDDKTEGDVCKHDAAPFFLPDCYPAITIDSPPPSWCPFRNRKRVDSSAREI